MIVKTDLRKAMLDLLDTSNIEILEILEWSGQFVNLENLDNLGKQINGETRHHMCIYA